MTHASSHHELVGVSAAVKPSCSAERAIWPMYPMSGARSAPPSAARLPATPTALPRLRSVRESPLVGRNQCRTTPMRASQLCLDSSQPPYP